MTTKMCRMIIAIGEVEAAKLIEDLVIIAQGKNEINERNYQLGELKHSDGWGIAYLNEQGKWCVYKSIKPIYEDHVLSNFKGLRTKAIIIHVRKATKGKKCLANTQPLYYKDEKGEFIFTHNGDINENFELKHRIIQEGDSDTVMWFNKIMSQAAKSNTSSLKEEFFNLKNYSSANFFFVTPEKILIGQNFKKDPEYHTMKFLKEKRFMIISSEILPTLKEREWNRLENRSILEINYKTAGSEK